MPKITLGTCRWTNKEHFPVRMYSSSMIGTEVAMTESQWILSKFPEYSAPKKQTIALRLVHALLLYPYPLHKHKIFDITKWCHDHLLPSSSGKNTVHAQENHAFCVDFSFCCNMCRRWFSLEQNCWFIEDKLSSTAVDFIRSEGIAERQHLIWIKTSSLSMPRT